MPKKTVSAYLDSGSIDLFAQQIREEINGTYTIAIHEANGELGWSDSKSAETWPARVLIRNDDPGVGYIDRLAKGLYLCVFYLRVGEEDAVDSTLSILFTAPKMPLFETVLKKVAPFIDCIIRQLRINIELSAVRRLSTDDRKALEFMLELDSIDSEHSGDTAVQKAMDLAAVHYDAVFCAVLVPRTSMFSVAPTSMAQGKRSSESLRKTADALYSRVASNQHIMMNELRLHGADHPQAHFRKANILSVPIFDSKERVTGVFVVARYGEYGKEDLRLSQVIATKVNSLVRVANRIAEDHLPRHEFLSTVADILRGDRAKNHALLHLDIDGLYDINDRHGHNAGDRAIKAVSQVVSETCREADVSSHLGGDQFALFLHGDSEKEAIDRAHEMLDTVSRIHLEEERGDVSLTASIGIAAFPSIVEDAAAGLNAAELSGRSAKEAGGNRVNAFHDPDASVAQRKSDLDILSKLQNALINDRFILFAQPIAPLCAEDPRPHFEVLLRLIGSDGCVLAPDRFLQTARRYQMMSAIDRWVITKSLESLASAENTLEVNMSCFNINISSQSLLAEDFIDFLENRIVEYGVAASMLCFEINETAVVKNLTAAQRCIHALRRLGCRVALDDFGTGYCSFAYLNDLPVHYIKVDGAFVRDLSANRLSESVVAGMVEIADVIDCFTVAEHVETELTMHQLRRMGVDYVQGFLIGKPQPFVELLDNIDAINARELPDKLTKDKLRVDLA